jgi:hypothetical protein
MSAWKKGGCDDMEMTRRLVDLFFVSVLLDAGAGDHWTYKEPRTGFVYERSEGIAVASLHMFTALAFTEGKEPIVDGKKKKKKKKIKTKNSSMHGLEELKTEDLASGFQVSEENPMLGIDPRAALLRSLGGSLLAHPDVFGAEGRPGNLVGKGVRSETLEMALPSDPIV